MSSGSLGMESSTVNSQDRALADFMWKQDVHSWLSYKWKTADIKKNTWWKQEKFEQSIFEVMKKALVDYVLKQGFFGKNDAIKNLKGGTVKVFRFVRAEPTQVEYTQENWNALMLYNVIYKKFDEQLHDKELKDILDDSITAIAIKCPKNLGKKKKKC